MFNQTIIAICRDCGRPFAGGRSGGGSLALGLGGSMYIEEMVVSGPEVRTRGVELSCPYCGGTGDLADGVYRAVSDGVSAFRSISPADAQRLFDSLTRFVKGEALEDEVVQAAPQPARAYVVSLLKKNWLALLLAILAATHTEVSGRATMDAIREGDAQISSQIEELRDAVREIADDLDGSARDGSEDEPRKPTDPCWCDSGRAFGRCHGSSD